MRPPVLATWLAEHLRAEEALIGDLIEDFHARQSVTWYWRQVLLLLIRTAAIGVVGHRTLAIRALIVVGLTSGLVASASGPTIDLARDLRVDVRSIGWVELDAPAGEHRLVPQMVLTVTNVSDHTVTSLHLNAQVRDADGQSSAAQLLSIGGLRGLAPGATSDPVTLQPPNGYLSREAPVAMLQHPQFVDAAIVCFVRSGFTSSHWTMLGPYTVPRQLAGVATARHVADDPRWTVESDPRTSAIRSE